VVPPGNITTPINADHKGYKHFNPSLNYSVNNVNNGPIGIEKFHAHALASVATNLFGVQESTHSGNINTKQFFLQAMSSS
jgi:hypothetical protein